MAALAAYDVSLAATMTSKQAAETVSVCWYVSEAVASERSTIDYEWDEARDAENARLREAVANACLTFTG